MTTVLLYASRPEVRDQFRLALGPRPAADLDPVDFLEAGDQRSLLAALDKGRADLVVLDGEAQPAGGLGIARQLRDEYPACPPVVVVIARADDRWLARWSTADAVVTHPVDPAELTAAVVPLLRDAAASPSAPTP
jgi:DNA-binding response OmpR family regulator